ncbi:hypothetical protein [uncultured Dokdonia sp.]|uniref:hypothetical protein n=1 Tax=uncultured Dokdonia sp. TaxID=575653 RepID=UPI00260D1EF3|nr:hypothetical protein [uncultured Dokdonia sp.]
MTFVEIQEKIHKNASVDFGDVFNNAFSLFQKIWLQGFLMQLIIFSVVFGVMFILYIPLMAGVFILDGGEGVEVSDAASILFLIGICVFYIVVIAAMSFFSMGLQAAFYRQVRMRDRGLESEQGVNWGMFFKKKYIKKLFVLSLATVGIGIASYLLCVVPIFYVIIPLQFISVIFAFNPELSVKEVIYASFNLGTKKWLIAFLLIIVSGLLAQFAGLILCGIGVLFTASFVYLPPYFIYKEVVGFYEDDDAIAQIGA